MHQISKRISGVIAAVPILVAINLQHILRPMRIMLKYRQTLNQPRTAD